MGGATPGGSRPTGRLRSGPTAGNSVSQAHQGRIQYGAHSHPPPKPPGSGTCAFYPEGYPGPWGVITGLTDPRPSKVSVVTTKTRCTILRVSARPSFTRQKPCGSVPCPAPSCCCCPVRTGLVGSLKVQLAASRSCCALAPLPATQCQDQPAAPCNRCVSVRQEARAGPVSPAHWPSRATAPLALSQGPPQLGTLHQQLVPNVPVCCPKQAQPVLVLLNVLFTARRL